MLQEFINRNLTYFLGEAHLVKAVGLAIAVSIILTLAVFFYYISKLVVAKVVNRLVNQTRSIFLQIVAKNNSLSLLAHLVAGIFIWCGSQILTDNVGLVAQAVVRLMNRLALLYVFFTAVVMTTRLIWSLNSYYEKKFKFAKQYPIYSYLKVLILLTWIISGILIISFFAHTSPWALLTGVGAVSAVFLLVFKDTLLGIVSSIQATASNIVRIGDRISIDKYGVDGTIMDIAINTVKLRNADNTSATIPTYMLTSEIVKNWRVMEESGGRRIKRSIHINIDSIKVCDSQLLAQASRFKIVADYIASSPGQEWINLALYRIYIEDYLAHNPEINHDYLTLVRHLDPDPSGLPLEIYAFSARVDIVGYERLQADLFEHCLAALPIFGLAAAQNL
jgi:miniconductance mechanosensitive channel